MQDQLNLTKRARSNFISPFFSSSSSHSQVLVHLLRLSRSRPRHKLLNDWCSQVASRKCSANGCKKNIKSASVSLSDGWLGEEKWMKKKPCSLEASQRSSLNRQLTLFSLSLSVNHSSKCTSMQCNRHCFVVSVVCSTLHLHRLDFSTFAFLFFFFFVYFLLCRFIITTFSLAALFVTQFYLW